MHAEMFLARHGLLREISFELGKQKINSPVVDGVFCTPNESFMIDILSRILPIKSGVFLDVGVNLGQTLIVLKSIDINREYVGFEPNSICNYYSSKLIAANDFPRCTLMPVGLSNHNGLIALSYYSRSDVDSSALIVANFRPNQTVIKQRFVPICTY